MPQLIVPTVRVHRSFLDAMREFAAEGRGSPDEFVAYVQALVAEADEGAPRPADRVPCTTLWWVDGDTYLGRIALRHRLTPKLLEVGGHIGYDVRPSARRRGHATEMLRSALPVAASLGIDPALVTCDAGNIASRRVIEANRGELDDQRGDKLRFWVPTSAL